MKKIICILITIILASSCSSNDSINNPLDNISLITYEYTPKKGVIDNDPKLVKYTFEKGKLSSRHEIYKAGSSALPYFGGKSTILQNRYIINWSGDIFDLKTKKIIFNLIGHDFYTEILEDRIIYKHRPFSTLLSKNDSIRHSLIESLYYYFDLKERKLIQITSGKQYLVEGVLSQNREMGLEFIIYSYYFLQVDSSSKKEVVVNYCGKIFLNKYMSEPIKLFDSLEVGINLISSFQPELPILWIDNENFLTQRRNGQLILADIHGKMKNFPKLTGLINELRSPSLFKNKKGRIIYHCPTEKASNYVVDIDNLTLKKHPNTIEIGNGYSREFVNGKFELEYNNKLIRVDSSFTESYTIKDKLIAIRTLKNCSPDKWDCNNYISVYNEGVFLKEIETRFISGIVGWIKE